jgi:glucose/arabinose dehydrogenase
MTAGKATGATAAIFCVVLLAALFTAADSTPQAAAEAPVVPAVQPQGGRGRGNATAELYKEHCSGCHGMDAAGGRAPSLFDEQWLKGTNDEAIMAAIRDGIDGTEMEGFGEAFSQEQIWALVHYIRNQTGNLRPRPEFVPAPDGLELKTEKETVRIEVVVDGLDTPWAIEFLPDGRMLISERSGTLRIFADGKLSEPVKGTPEVNAVQDGGLLDVIAHPDYANNGWIYIAYAERQPGWVAPPPSAEPEPAPGGRGRGGPPRAPAMTVVARGKINANNEWVDQEFIYRADPSLYTPSGAHYGLRFIWDNEGHLFYSIGERGDVAHSQDLASALGKIHRVNDDGSAPADNPFVGQAGAVPTIWSYGHRNPQGFAWHPVTGELWESEHGPNAGDEINVIVKGGNYGWGRATKGTQPNMLPSVEGMIDPVLYWVPSMAPAGISFYTGDRYPNWKNTSLFVGGLVGQRLERLETLDGKVTHQEVIFDQLGRVRDITEGPDGYLYIAVQDPTGIPGVPLPAPTPGKVIRLVPVN